ncbi:hypothetical protein PN398_14950 [Romboutsia sp. 1001216sp1]|uniref:hypothetical protein n=1 Tax=unclassified Romboutsia TaxID=2626894 RepID=UPI00189F35A0|nr:MULTISPECIES: hypothetical protein [unclassified Romboutsia]MDB8792019.1 hypothetical protein [Romboutsia sp. 1001216sp1]MDB8802511.1 hypothetical protein [Romboutsia sp. 1001216sp1]MDB8813908.1 hypothetical protein [Romboutsia sp. 1001216sp1]
MKELKPYLKMLNKNTYIYMFILLLLIIGIDGMNLIGAIYTKNYTIEDNFLIFRSETYYILGLMMFICSICISQKDFSIAISIKGDRKSYLKSMILYIICMCFVFTIIGVGVEFLESTILNGFTGYDAVIISRSIFWEISEVLNKIQEEITGGSWATSLIYTTRDDTLLYILDMIINIFINNFIFSALGLFIGALVYRLKKVTILLLFAGMPVLSIIYLLIEFFKGKYGFVEKYIETYWSNLGHIIYACQNILVKALIATIFITGAILLLIKAPIKEYAHDLI